MTAELVNLSFQNNHKPVLLTEIVTELSPSSGEIYLDMTAGAGGHARAIAQIVGEANLVLTDADREAVRYLKSVFPKATVYHRNFADLARYMVKRNDRFDMILADLGLSMRQLQQADRGFSFLKNGPLDMRLDTSQGQTLEQLLQTVSATQLTEIIKTYGQEERAAVIAAAIKAQRPRTTHQLAQLVSEMKGTKRQSRLHPATKTFMALRIWTNDELNALQIFLATAPLLLKPKGRLAVISFHSLEDALVKQSFRDWSDGVYDANYFINPKKPIIPQLSALASHPQARSAKLRLLRKY